MNETTSEPMCEPTKRPPVSVRLEPEGCDLTFERCPTVARLLNQLGLRPTDCLVICRGDEQSGQPDRLLTHDLKITPGARLIVRKVASSG